MILLDRENAGPKCTFVWAFVVERIERRLRAVESCILAMNRALYCKRWKKKTVNAYGRLSVLMFMFLSYYHNVS